MKVIIHDMTREEFEKLYTDRIKNEAETEIIFSGEGKGEGIKECTGCFCCWVKTPRVCVLNDKYKNIGKLFSKADEIIVISRCVYGSYSPFVKNVLDRSIPFLLPFFKIVNNEVHHKVRYKRKIKFKVHFYGETITGEEKNIAEKMIAANSINFAFKENSVSFDKFTAEITF